MTVDVIIIKFNAEELEKACIESVLKHTKGSYHLTVYDNYPLNHNLGQLWNELISVSDADYICLLNSDTEVEAGWLDKLMETFELDEVGVVGPSTDHSGNHQCKKEAITGKFMDYGKDCPGWVLSGFCLLFPKKIWQLVSGFPEDFGFYGQEVNFIDKIISAGYRQIWRTDVFVHHEGGGSVKAAEKRGEINEAEERKKAHDLFIKKRRELESTSN